MKKISQLFLIPIIGTILVPKVYAFDVSIVSPQTADNIVNTGGGGTVSWSYSAGTTYGEEYKCSYKTSVTYNPKATINALNMENEPLIEDSSTPLESIVAGTQIKLNLFETRTFSWNYYINDIFQIRVKKESYGHNVTTYQCLAETDNSNCEAIETTMNCEKYSPLIKLICEGMKQVQIDNCVPTTKYNPNETSSTVERYEYKNSHYEIIKEDGSSSTSKIKPTCNASLAGATIIEYSYDGLPPKVDYAYEDRSMSKGEVRQEYINDCKKRAAQIIANNLDKGYTEPVFDMILPDSNSVSGTNTLYISAKDNTHNTCSGGLVNKDCQINYESIANVPGTKTTYGDSPVYKYSWDNPGAGKTKLSLVRYYFYNPKTACLNTKDAKVTYTSGTTCNDKDQITIVTTEHTEKDGTTRTYWSYFVPLDAKSTDKVTIKYISTKGEDVVLSNEKCQYVIRHNPVFFIQNSSDGMYELKKKSDTKYDSYEDYLSPARTDEIFNCTNPNDCYSYCIVTSAAHISSVKSALASRIEGSENQIDLPYGAKCYGVYNTEKDQERISEDVNKKYTGNCKLQVLVSFPITQRFYNEEEKVSTTGKKSTIFKGFKFYYRPVDINNPFPNIESITTLWENYNQSTNSYRIYNDNVINFSDSYNKLTYYTKNITSIKNDFEPEVDYTNWKNIYSDGTNAYIDENKAIIRNTPYNGYKIGCGPDNYLEYALDENRKTTTIKNPMYLPYCRGENS